MKKLTCTLLIAGILSGCNSGGAASSQNNSNQAVAAVTASTLSTETTPKLVFQDPSNVCSSINTSLPYHAEFCQSVQQYSNRLVTLIQSLIPNYANYDVSVNISINEEQPVTPTSQNPDVDQTTSLYDNLKFYDLALYPEDSFIFSGQVTSLGYSGGNFLSFLSQIQGADYQGKNPMDYIINIANDPSSLNPLATGIGTQIDNMGARAADDIFKYQDFQDNPYPLGNYQPQKFTPEQFNNHNSNDSYRKYWGVAAGGGSGAGFTIAVNDPENVVLAGGMGGGGGFSSPGSIQYESDNDTVSSLLQTAAGSSAGGGMQFVADNDFSKNQGFTDGLGFGGGAAYGDGHDSNSTTGGNQPADPVAPIMTYYPDAIESPVTLPVNGLVAPTAATTEIQRQFAAQLKQFKNMLVQNPQDSILIKGAGGMGVGAQLMYLGVVPGSSNEYRLQEYLPHAISSGASFVVSIQLTPKGKKKLTAQRMFSSAEQQFYQNLDTYYVQATEQTMHNIAGRGGYLCSYYICKSNQNYLVSQAIKDFGSKDAIPSWLKIDTCSFQKDTDPNVCPTP
jgi:hypothetical protein